MHKTIGTGAADPSTAGGGAPAAAGEGRSLAGTVAALRARGHLTTKIGSLPVVVFWSDDRAWAIEDRCPHLGFPLHRGTVESGLVTCHWHHARFDLESGCTLDPWADDARGFDVDVRDDEVWVVARPGAGQVLHLRRRLREGLEDGYILVTAKAVLGLLDAGVDPAEIVAAGIDFGTRNRRQGWGAGLTVLVAMANLLPHLDPADRPLALVHGLTFVSRDTSGNPPRFEMSPLDTDRIPAERSAAWYRRFVDTRSADAAERTLATAIAPDGESLRPVEAMMFAAVTDHVFIDGGHTLDFTNKAFEALDHVGAHSARRVLTSLVPQTASAERSEESSAWRHPDDLAALAAAGAERLLAALGPVAGPGRSDDEALDGIVWRGGSGGVDRSDDEAVDRLAWELLADEPAVVVDAIVDAAAGGRPAAEIARAVAYAAALRICRFHTQNDFGDWNSVHHTFTAANALHQAMRRNPTPELARGLVHAGLALFLDRFLNVPPARLPQDDHGEMAELRGCWDVQGAVDEAGAIAYGHVVGGGEPAKLVAALGSALLEEDAGFHWYQLFEAAVRQSGEWPDGSRQQALVLSAFSRFLAAHTPSRREQPTTFRIAQRLRRGDELHSLGG